MALATARGKGMRWLLSGSRALLRVLGTPQCPAAAAAGALPATWRLQSTAAGWGGALRGFRADAGLQRGDKVRKAATQPGAATLNWPPTKKMMEILTERGFFQQMEVRVEVRTLPP